MNFINTASEFYGVGRYPETHCDKKYLVEVTYGRNGCSELTVSGGFQSILAGRRTRRCSPVFGQVRGREPVASACSCDGDQKQRQQTMGRGGPQASTSTSQAPASKSPTVFKMVPHVEQARYITTLRGCLPRNPVRFF